LPEDASPTASSLVKRPTRNFDAYNLYLKGRYELNQMTREGLVNSKRYFQEAIELDPDYALAYMGIADAYALMVAHGPYGSRTGALILFRSLGGAQATFWEDAPPFTFTPPHAPVLPAPARRAGCLQRRNTGPRPARAHRPPAVPPDRPDGSAASTDRLTGTAGGSFVSPPTACCGWRSGPARAACARPRRPRSVRRPGPARSRTRRRTAAVPASGWRPDPRC